MSNVRLRSRRRLLTSGLAAAMVAATGLPAQALGKRGGRLVAGLSGTDGVLDHSAAGGAQGMFLRTAQGAIFDTLTEVGADGTLTGELATQWEPNADATQWTVTLRQDVQFHDGTPLTSAHIIDGLAPHLTGLLGDVDAVTQQGLHIVGLTLRAGDANLPYRLSHPDLFISHNGVGTGLYQLGRFSQGHMLARRVDIHWKSERAGWFDEVELLNIDVSANRLAALRSGRVDAIDAPDAHAQRLLASNADMFVAPDGSFATSSRISTPARTGQNWPMDNARFTQRWWRA
ncbi:ABC transporter substrate-binding protein [Aestuariibius sp. HNIBRBA575]|uniref:ABC transporter substrate-binding protein n=1 Tax=Aestuariibius sp. HNIBRBA575 TaxID=3233343 RepID=UPI0034A4F6E7